MSAYEDINAQTLSGVAPEKKEAPDAAKQVQGLSKSLHHDDTAIDTDSPAQVNQVKEGGSDASEKSVLPVQLAYLEQEERGNPEGLTPWGKPVNIVHVADEMFALIKQHCVMTENEAAAIVLWIIS